MSTPAHAATLADSASAVEFDVPAPGSTGYDEWRKTGKLPDATETPAEPEREEIEPIEVPEPGNEGEAAAPEHDAEPAAASAAAPTQRKKDAAARLREVLAERKKDRELIEQLTRKLAGQPSAEPQSRTAAEPEVKAKVEAKEKPKRPKFGDTTAEGKSAYKNYGEFEAAIEKYEDALDQWNRDELLKLVEDRQTKAHQSQKIEESERVIAQEFSSRVIEARKKYPDFDAIALDATLPIVKGSVIDQFIISSKHGTDVAYYLGQNRDALDEMVRLNPLDQARSLFEIEQIFVPKTAAPKPPARTLTKAPPPPHQVSGKSPVADPVEKAVKDGDQTAFTRAENEKVLAKWRESRGRRK